MKKNLLNLIIMFIAGALVGLIIGWYLPHQPKPINQLRGGVLNKNIARPVVNNLRGQVETVSGDSVKFGVKQLSAQGPVSVTKVAKIDTGTALYLLTSKTAVEAGDVYQKKLADLRNQLKTAIVAKDTKKLASLKEELRTITIANGEARTKQASELNAKINSLPAGSVERLDAELAYLNLTSAFKYSKISLQDIKTGDVIQAWAKEDLSNKDSFIATKIEIKR